MEEDACMDLRAVDLAVESMAFQTVQKRIIFSADRAKE